jgi:hypothetical protein
MNEQPSQQPSPAPTEHRAVSRWGQERRLEFIDWRLQWDGRINRADLTAFFGISVPQASLDIAKYLEMAPSNAVYDRSAKVYLAAPDFQPHFASNTPQRYLNELHARAAAVLQPELSFMGWAPTCDLAPSPGRAVPDSILLPLLRAIRERLQVDIEYQSMSSALPTHRAISPHAMAFDGFRWHVRAYCHLREQFRDFVVARMTKATATERAALPSDRDESWSRKVKLALGPNPSLPPAAQRVIELDYGMDGGRVELECRQALLFYTLKRLGLLKNDEVAPNSQQIVLLNRNELEPHLPRSMEDR